MYPFQAAILTGSDETDIKVNFEQSEVECLKKSICVKVSKWGQIILQNKYYIDINSYTVKSVQEDHSLGQRQLTS